MDLVWREGHIAGMNWWDFQRGGNRFYSTPILFPEDTFWVFEPLWRWNNTLTLTLYQNDDGDFTAIYHRDQSQLYNGDALDWELEVRIEGKEIGRNFVHILCASFFFFSGCHVIGYRHQPIISLSNFCSRLIYSIILNDIGQFECTFDNTDGSRAH